MKRRIHIDDLFVALAEWRSNDFSAGTLFEEWSVYGNPMYERVELHQIRHDDSTVWEVRCYYQLYEVKACIMSDTDYQVMLQTDDMWSAVKLCEVLINTRHR